MNNRINIKLIAEAIDRLSVLFCTLLIVCAHLVLFDVAALLVWLCDISQVRTASFLREALDEKHLGTLAVYGISATSVAAAYAWLIRKIYTRSRSLVAAYLVPYEM